MSQCVPSWDLDDSSAPSRPSLNLRTHSNSFAADVPSLDYEVAELTWENGQLAMHGLGPPRVPNKQPVHFSPPAKYGAAAWEKPRAAAGTGTLESIVNQATCHVPHLTKSASTAENNASDHPPWFDHRRAVVNPGGASSMAVTMDALVPCNNRNNDNNNDHREPSRHVAETAAAARAGMCSCKTSTPSVSESTGTCSRGVKGRRQMTATFDNGEREFGAGGLTSTSMWSADNTSSGKEYTKTTSGEDHDSFCHSRSQREGDDAAVVKKKKGHGKSSGSTKRIRAAAIHNQSERKRRDKINQRMKTLQKLVPNSSKTDKASILDEVIEYLKQLQAQVQVMNRMNIPQMMLPQLAQLHQQQQQLQMSMMGMGMGMGMGMMDLNTLSRAAAAAGMPSVIQPPAPASAPFMPMPSWPDMQATAGDRLTPTPELLSAFLACQSQPMTMDGYSRLAAFYHQFQQGAGSGSKN